MTDILYLLKKTPPVSLRLREDLKADVEQIASYLGLSVSSYIHSVLVQQIRKERSDRPEAFEQNNHGIEHGGDIKLSTSEKDRRTGSD